jgi:hypothetical protein
MPPIKRYPTDVELQEFKVLCTRVHKLYKEPQFGDRGHSKTRQGFVHEVQVFVMKLRVTNISSMLSYVEDQGHNELVRALSSMTDVYNKEDSDGNTVLHHAVKKRDTRSVCHLLEANAGVDFDAINLNGESALHVAVRTVQIGVVRELLKVGANIYEMNTSISKHKSDNVIHVLAKLMLDRPGGEETPVWQDIRRMLDRVDHFVRVRVAMIDESYLQERELAVMMGQHKHVGEGSLLMQHVREGSLDPLVVRIILKEAYPGGVGVVEPHTMTQLVKDAYMEQSQLP